MTAAVKPQNNLKYSIECNVSTTGEFFPKDSPKSYAYDGSGNVSTITATDILTGNLFVRTYTYSSNKITADSGWVKR